MNDLKVSTGLQDAWGQEIFLGDLVVDIENGGYFNRTPRVVTKIGAANNFQYNNSSYTKPGNVVVVTDQYVKFKGQTEHEKLLDKHPIDLAPVKKKAPPMVWAVCKESYVARGATARYWVFNYANETLNAGYKELVVIRDMLGIGTDRVDEMRWSERNWSGKPGFEFGYSAKPVSGKKLQEWGAKLGIDFIKFANQEISDPAVLAILNTIK